MIKILHRHNVKNFGEWVYVSYTPDDDVDGPALRTACEELGGRILGSGGMEGMRDVDYCFDDNVEAARQFVERATVMLGDVEVAEREG